MESRCVRNSAVGRAPETSVLLPMYVASVVAATQSLPAQPVHRSKPGTTVNVDTLAYFPRSYQDKSFYYYIIDAAPCVMVH